MSLKERTNEPVREEVDAEASATGKSMLWGPRWPELLRGRLRGTGRSWLRPLRARYTTCTDATPAQHTRIAVSRSV